MCVISVNMDLYLVQRAHGEHRAVMSFQSFDQCRVFPDVNVARGGP